MVTVAGASATLCCQPKERNKSQKAANSKIALDVKTKPVTTAKPKSVSTSNLPPLVLKEDPTAVLSRSLKSSTFSTKPIDDKKNKNASKKTLGGKSASQDIVKAKVDVSKLIGVFDPSKATAPEPAIENPIEVIAAKRERIGKMNWDNFDSKFSQKWKKGFAHEWIHFFVIDVLTNEEWKINKTSIQN